MNNSKKGLILVILLSIVLVGVIGAGTIKDKYASKNDNNEYESSVAVTSEETAAEKKDNNDNVSADTDESKTKGLVEKLRAKQNVRVLMLGDDMAMSMGRSSEKGIWSDGIKNLIEKTYGSKTDITLLAKEGATTETALKTVQENDISNYDLVILCYGNNDSKSSLKLENVKNNYTNIVNQIRAKSPEALIMAVLESSLELNNSYRLAVSDVATTNHLISVDMRTAFNSSGMKEASIAKNGFPNDQGYQIYTQTVAGKIKEAIG